MAIPMIHFELLMHNTHTLHFIAAIFITKLDDLEEALTLLEGAVSQLQHGDKHNTLKDTVAAVRKIYDESQMSTDHCFACFKNVWGGVCKHFAAMFVRLADEINTINKEPEQEEKFSTTPTLHATLATNMDHILVKVQIKNSVVVPDQDEFYYIDSYWASGYFDAKGTYESYKQLNGKYLFMDTSEMNSVGDTSAAHSGEFIVGLEEPVIELPNAELPIELHKPQIDKSIKDIIKAMVESMSQ